MSGLTGFYLFRMFPRDGRMIYLAGQIVATEVFQGRGGTSEREVRTALVRTGTFSDIVPQEDVGELIPVAVTRDLIRNDEEMVSALFETPDDLVEFVKKTAAAFGGKLPEKMG